jgi:hypothetical protein
VAESDPLLRRPALLAVAVAGPVLEVVGLSLAGLTTSVGLAPQVTAPAPFGVFHDLRWLLVFHRSWAGFVVLASLVLAFRSAVTAGLVILAWPDDVPRAAPPRLLARTVAFTAVTMVLLAPWAGLLFGMAVVPLSWLFFAAVPPALAVGLFIHHGSVRAGWCRGAPPLRTVGWLALTFVVRSAAGGVLSASPPVARPIVAAAAGLFDAWAWRGIVHGAARRTAATRWAMPVAPVGVALVVAVVAAGVTVSFSVTRAQADTGAAGETAAAGHAGHRDGHPVLMVAGFGTHWDGRQRDVLGPGFVTERFSYRGLGPDGAPLPYERADTLRPVDESVHLLARQIDRFHRATGRRVAIVAESEGALVASAYVLGLRPSAVDDLVLLSPLVEPGRVYYPPRGERGWGVAAGWLLRLLAHSVKALSGVNLSPDSPLLRSLTDHAPALRAAIGCTPALVTQVVVFPLADAVAAPPGRLGDDVIVVPAFHGGLLEDGSVGDALRRLVAGGRPATPPGWSLVERITRAASAAWQVPGLPVGLNPVWTARGSSTGGESGRCAAAARELVRWLR